MKKTSVLLILCCIAGTIIAKTINAQFLTYTTAAASAYSALPSVNCTLVKVQNTSAADITFVHNSDFGTATTNTFLLKAGATFPFTVVANSAELSASAPSQVTPAIEVSTENY